MSQANSSRGLARRIGLRAAVLLVIANMVGTGIFTTSGLVLAELQNPQALLWCWFFGAVFALTGALCYGELGAMIPHAGGEYIYLREGFGPLPAFMAGWISLIVGFSAPIAAAAIAFGVYLIGNSNLTPWWDWQIFDYTLLAISPVSVLAISAVLLLSLLHSRSFQLGLRLQGGLTLFKVAFILILITASMYLTKQEPALLKVALHSEHASWQGGSFAVALIYVSFAYSGWNAASYLGGEIKQPGRNLPLALIIGTVIVSVFYLLLNISFLATVPLEELSGTVDVAAVAARKIFGENLGAWFGIAVAIGLLSVVSAMIMVGPRVYYAMAEDGFFPQHLSNMHQTQGTPRAAITFQATVAILMILTASFDTLLIYIGFLLSLSSLLTVFALLRLRRTQAQRSRPYRTWGYPLTPWLFILGNVWIIIYSVLQRPMVAFWGFITLALGLLCYLLIQKAKSLSS